MDIQEIMKEFDMFFFTKENEKYTGISPRVILIHGELMNQDQYIIYKLQNENNR